MTRIDQRSARRMLRRSRSLWATLCVLVVVVAAVWVGTELVLFALGLPPLLATPTAMLDTLASGSALGLVAGAAGAVFAVICLWGAFSPGRTGRRVLGDERAPMVVDDSVVAGALSREASVVAGVGQSQVRTHISRRRAVVDVTPSTGFVVDPAPVERDANGALGILQPGPALSARVFVRQSGALS